MGLGLGKVTYVVSQVWVRVRVRVRVQVQDGVRVRVRISDLVRVDYIYS